MRVGLKSLFRSTRRDFITQGSAALVSIALPFSLSASLHQNPIPFQMQYDVIIVGGSYSGLAAGLALGRSLRRVLIIDNGKPCNSQTPRSHNFLTQDGKTPKEISTLARQQVESYPTVKFFSGSAIQGRKIDNGFEIRTASSETFEAKKLIFAAGIKDNMPDLEGYAQCWGISVLHCPYCHGYEVRKEKTGVLGNGEFGFTFAMLISNWTNDLTLFTNGQSELTSEQTQRLNKRKITITETEIESLQHQNGYLQQVLFRDRTATSMKALYVQSPFEQHCPIPESLGCALTEEGHLRTDPTQATTVPGIFACGDSTSRMRTVANAVATGTTAGMMVNKEMILEEF